jgi:hypothetical protein
MDGIGRKDTQHEEYTMTFRRCEKCGSDFDHRDRRLFCPHELYNPPLQKAAGFKRTTGHRKIAINIPEEDFIKIKQRAESDGVPFTAKAVELIRCGLLDYEDSERHDPGVRKKFQRV